MVSFSERDYFYIRDIDIIRIVKSKTPLLHTSDSDQVLQSPRINQKIDIDVPPASYGGKNEAKEASKMKGIIIADSNQGIIIADSNSPVLISAESFSDSSISRGWSSSY